MASGNRKRKRDSEPSVQHKIIIACDFGTTFSGAAWAHTANSESRQIITQWPDAESSGLDGLSSGKVPTEILYDGDRVLWGFQIPQGSPRYSWFKLDLERDKRIQLFSLLREYPDPRALPPTFDPVKTATDYLRLFREHVERQIKHALPAIALDMTPIFYCLTVPAIWNEHAKAKTMACAEAAGMGSNVLMISEPEAAATFALDCMNPHGLEVGSTFVLCDAGGGTVDLISYKILALRPVLKVREEAAGSGGMCGSSFINRIFARYLKNKLSGDEDWDDETLQEALDRFEHVVKRKFSNDPERQYLVPVAGISDNSELGIRRGKIKLEGSTVKEFFDPVLEEVVTLVKGQIRATVQTPKAVLLVGGFGQSIALRDAIHEVVKHDGIEVIQPVGGWNSVVSGALMRALAQQVPRTLRLHVSERKARKHYGVAVDTRYIVDLHDVGRTHWDNFDGRLWISAVKWVIKKGDAISDSTPIKFGFTDKQLVSSGRPTSAYCAILCCPDIEDDGAPLYPDDARNVELANFQLKLHLIPMSQFSEEQGKDGKAYWVVNFAIEVTFLSGATRFEMVQNGQNYGTVETEWA